MLVEVTMRWRNGLVLWSLLGAPVALAQGRNVTDTPSHAEGAGPTDGERARALEAAIRSDAVLRDDEINIEVTGKRVRLSGKVDSGDERLHAEEVVRQSDPTLTVENLLQPTSDVAAAPVEDKVTAESKRAARKVDKVATEVGDAITDGWITSKVKSQLMAADGVHGSAIAVKTTDHVVTLEGTVRSTAEHRKALTIARETRGVASVVDELRLAPKR
jgi:hyperosmotically inducible protein